MHKMVLSIEPWNSHTLALFLRKIINKSRMKQLISQWASNSKFLCGPPNSTYYIPSVFLPKNSNPLPTIGNSGGDCKCPTYFKICFLRRLNRYKWWIRKMAQINKRITKSQNFTNILNPTGHTVHWYFGQQRIRKWIVNVTSSQNQTQLIALLVFVWINSLKDKHPRFIIK